MPRPPARSATLHGAARRARRARPPAGRRAASPAADAAAGAPRRRRRRRRRPRRRVQPAARRACTRSRAAPQLAAEALTRDSAARAAGLRFVARAPLREVTSAVEIAQLLRDDPAVVGIVGDAESGRTLDAIPVLRGRRPRRRARHRRRLADRHEHRALRAQRVGLPRDAERRGREPGRRRAISPTRSAPAARPSSIATTRTAATGRRRSSPRSARGAARSCSAIRTSPASPSGTRSPRTRAAPAPTWCSSRVARRTRRTILRALRAAGVHVPFVGGDAVAPLATQPEFAGARFATPYAAAKHAPARRRRPRSSPRTPSAGTRRRPRAPRSPTTPRCVLGRATIAVGRDRARIREWLEALGGANAAVAGVTGPIAFDRTHDARDRSVSIVTVRGERRDDAPSRRARRARASRPDRPCARPRTIGGLAARGVRRDALPARARGRAVHRRAARREPAQRRGRGRAVARSTRRCSRS